VRALIQRVREASVSVGGERIAAIGPGLLVLVGVRAGESPEAPAALARRVVEFRVFRDDAGKMGRSLLDTGGALLAVSQMTLYGATDRGRRPSFDSVARGEEALPRFEAFVEAVRAAGVPVETGRFGAMMDVALVNDGPVTFLLEVDGGGAA
jgi:D-tyrosyl-tRNA(Tyr) deacylase